jgi:hypothetical protein
MKTNISIFEFVKDWENEGYGIALMEDSGDRDIPDKVITPYIDPSDYPTMIVSKSGNGAKVMNMGEGHWYIAFHSGALEERFNQQKS